MGSEDRTLKKAKWLCYRASHVLRRENGHVTEVVSLMDGDVWESMDTCLMDRDCSCYERWSV